MIKMTHILSSTKFFVKDMLYNFCCIEKKHFISIIKMLTDIRYRCNTAFSYIIIINWAELLCFYLCGFSADLLFLNYSANDHETQRRGRYHGWLVFRKTKFYKNHQGVALKQKHLFKFLRETILLINESFWNFAHEDIINHQIIPNG